MFGEEEEKGKKGWVVFCLHKVYFNEEGCDPFSMDECLVVAIYTL